MVLSQRIQEVNSYFFDKYKIGISDSELVIIDDWDNFCQRRNLQQQSTGVYSVRERKAFVRKSHLPLNVYHELFGHGMYVEFSKRGIELQSLETKLFQEERELGIETLEQLNAFRNSSETHQLLMQLKKLYEREFEGFALWTEAMLSASFGELEQFKNRIKNDPQLSLAEEYLGFASRFGERALVYSCGFPKFYSSLDIQELMKNILGGKQIDFLVLYGSRKPYSDIDIFGVGEDEVDITNDWLDLNIISRERFRFLLKNFDISISDPLFSGEFIDGDLNLFENSKNHLESSPIPEDAVNYHLEHSQTARRIALNYPEGSKERMCALGYETSYILNARELHSGRKPLTLIKLLELKPEAFRNFKFNKSMEATAK